MSEDLKEKCGIAAVKLIGDPEKHPIGNVTPYLYKMLLQQQNRGQLSAGITTFNPDRRELLKTYKELGSVNKVFRTHDEFKQKKIFDDFNGTMGIGHVRYATCGPEGLELAQPFERWHGRLWKWFSFGFNGNIANYSELRKELAKYGYHLTRETDTEVILHFISKQLNGQKPIELQKIFHGLSKVLDGAYSLSFINASGELAVIRDPLGFRPVVYGKNKYVMAAASESAALINLGITRFQPLRPGEMILFKDNGFEVKKFAKTQKGKSAHCMFEWVYFANAGSVIDDKSVYDVRWALGKKLAEKETLGIHKDEFVVVPVPDTAKPVGDAYAAELGLVAKEGLLRNRYVGRTFIEGSDRIEKIRNKFTLNKSILQGKKVILVEDSIVRGSTVKTLIEYIRREGGAKEVHVRVACPPIFYPCFYGIDMTTIPELIASQTVGKKGLLHNGKKELAPETTEKIRRRIGADSLRYQSIDDLINAIGLPEKRLCTACVSGHYKTNAGRRLVKKAIHSWSNILGHESGGLRTYE